MIPLELVAFVAGLVVALVTTPVGVSGAVFLLPVQIDVLGVPNPRLTPTNLLYNVVSGPGALLRSRRRLTGPLTRQMLAGTLPGVVVGAVLRVEVASDPTVFRLLAAALLLPLGLLVLRGPRGAARSSPRITGPTITVLAFVAGVAGGVYGIGGGSLLGPVLVAAGWSVATVAPAALASTFVTSVVGVGAFAALGALGAGGGEPIDPDWSLGLASGLGGLLGGYAGAALVPRLPGDVLRRLLGCLAVALAVVYVVQALR